MLSTFVTDRRMSKCSRKWAWMPIGSPSPGQEYCQVSTKLIQYVLYDEKFTTKTLCSAIRVC